MSDERSAIVKYLRHIAEEHALAAESGRVHPAQNQWIRYGELVSAADQISKKLDQKYADTVDLYRIVRLSNECNGQAQSVDNLFDAISEAKLRLKDRDGWSTP